MKIVLTTSGDTLDAPFESRFGRAPKFAVYDLLNDGLEIIDNSQNLNSAQGAGIQSAETVVRLGATAIITGHCGPKAFRVLSAAGVDVFPCNAVTVGEALADYRAGSLSKILAADVEGHW